MKLFKQKISQASAAFLTVGVFVWLFTSQIQTAEAANIIHVDQNSQASVEDGTLLNPYKTIGTAIAQSIDGDTIVVETGVYNENLTIGKAVTLQGVNYPTIQPVDIAIPAVSIDAGSATISTFNFPVMNTSVVVNGGVDHIITQNKFASFTPAITNNTVSTIDARTNWWGLAVPLFSTEIAGPALFSPWWSVEDGSLSASLPPAPTITWPPHVNLANQSHTTITGNGSPLSTINYQASDGNNIVIGSVTSAEDGSFTLSPDLTSLLDGSVSINISVSDSAGNTGAPSSATLPKDTLAPMISADDRTINNTPVTITASVADINNIASTIWTQLSDPAEGTVIFEPGNAVSTTVSADQDGDYLIRLTARDAYGNTTVKDIAFIWDTHEPVISLISDSGITLLVGSAYIEQGATAVDNLDGDISTAMVISGSPDMNQTGDYQITYTAVDSAGNTAISVRTVHVVDNIKPVITLAGPATVEIEFGDGFTEPGFLAIDNYDGDISSLVTANNNISLGRPGTYNIAYKVNDSSGNEAVATRTIVVKTKANQQEIANDTFISQQQNEVIIPTGTSETFYRITIPDSLANTILNLTAIMSNREGRNVTIPADLTIVFQNHLTLVIPARTVISGGDDWSGLFNLPMVSTLRDGIPATIDGQTLNNLAIFEIGAGENSLMLNQPVKFYFAGQADARVGFIRQGAFQAISDQCQSDSPTLSRDTECWLRSDRDLIVWANHLTRYILYHVDPADADTALPIRITPTKRIGQSSIASITIPTLENTADVNQGLSAIAIPDLPDVPTDPAPLDQNNKQSESPTINWAPWIIIFVLILLSGAITGGYYYLFGGEEDEATSSIADRKLNGRQRSATYASPTRKSSYRRHK